MSAEQPVSISYTQMSREDSFKSFDNTFYFFVFLFTTLNSHLWSGFPSEPAYQANVHRVTNHSYSARHSSYSRKSVSVRGLIYFLVTASGKLRVSKSESSLTQNLAYDYGSGSHHQIKTHQQQHVQTNGVDKPNNPAPSLSQIRTWVLAPRIPSHFRAPQPQGQHPGHEDTSRYFKIM